MSNDPDQIREDIERTRANLSYDVNALADEANPKNMAQRQADKAVSSVRRSARNLKERIMGSDDTQQYGTEQYGYGQYGQQPYGAQSTMDKAKGKADEVKGTVQEKAGDVKGTVQEKADDVKGTVQDKVEGAKGAVQDAAQEARAMAQQAPDQMRHQVRGNPLAAGLVAFGLGSILGSLLPATRYESRAADAVKEKAAPMMEEVKEMAKDAVDQVKPAAQQAVQNVKEVASDAKDQVAEQAKAAKDNTTHQAADAKDNVQAVREADKNTY